MSKISDLFTIQKEEGVLFWPKISYDQCLGSMAFGK